VQATPAFLIFHHTFIAALPMFVYSASLPYYWV